MAKLRRLHGRVTPPILLRKRPVEIPHRLFNFWWICHYECRTSQPRHTTVLLSLIRQLYDLEDRAKLWSAERRGELRQRESLRVLKQIRAYIDGPSLDRLLPKSDFARAIGYMKNNWDALLLYTTDGRFPIDNNETEHLMKQVATGRNYAEFRAMRRCGRRRAGVWLNMPHWVVRFQVSNSA